MELTKTQADELLAAVVLDNDATRFPWTKVRIPWPDGGSENLWARKMGGGLLLLENSPLFPVYLHKDFVQEGSLKLIHRHFPVKLVFRYEPLGGDEDLERRKAIFDAAKEAGGQLSFMFPGVGYVLLPEDADPTAVSINMLGTGFITDGPRIERVDENGDQEFIPVIPEEGDGAEA